MKISTYRRIILGNKARLVRKIQKDDSFSIGWFIFDRVYLLTEIKKHKSLLYCLNIEFLNEVKIKYKHTVYELLLGKKKLNSDVIREILDFI